MTWAHLLCYSSTITFLRFTLKHHAICFFLSLIFYFIFGRRHHCHNFWDFWFLAFTIMMNGCRHDYRGSQIFQVCHCCSVDTCGISSFFIFSFRPSFLSGLYSMNHSIDSDQQPLSITISSISISFRLFQLYPDHDCRHLVD